MEYSLKSISEDVAVKLELDREKRKDDLAKLPVDEIKNKLAGLNAHRRELERKQAGLKLLIVIFIFVACAYAYARNSYISSAISHFDQCLAICSPYLSQEERIKLLAQYASVASKNDYQVLINSINKIAETNELKLPLFIIL